MSFFLMILFGILSLFFLGCLIWGIFGDDINDRKDIIFGFAVFFGLSLIVFMAHLSTYCSPHHGTKPEIEDFPKKACMDTIYHHHDGKTYVRYKLCWKDDKVWED